jgi:hypothetical protein
MGGVFRIGAWHDPENAEETRAPARVATATQTRGGDASHRLKANRL